MDNANPKPYELRFSIVVDAPEKRGSSYRPVEAGSVFHNTWCFATQREAVTVFEGMLRGEWDFGSEYVTKATVCARRRNRSPRTVRIPHERRERGAEFVKGWQ